MTDRRLYVHKNRAPPTMSMQTQLPVNNLCDAEREKPPTLTATKGPVTANASSRRIKKRELDRRAQQAARERTKARIAHLEKIVEAVQGPEEGSRVSALTTQVADLQKRNDLLAKTLRQIMSLAGHIRLPEDGPLHEDVLSDDNRSAGHDLQSAQVLIQQSNLYAQASVDSLSNSDDGSAQVVHGHQVNDVTPSIPIPYCSTVEIFNAEDAAMKSTVQEPPVQSNLCSLVGNGSPPKYGDFNDFTRPIVGQPDSAVTLRNPVGLSEFDTLLLPNSPAQNVSTYDMMFWNTDTLPVMPDQACDCVTRKHDQPQRIRRNLWRFANDTLTSTRTSDMQVQVSRERCGSNDSSAIKAILEGWEAIPDLEPSWQALRLIDQELFATCGNVERLAILHIMHLLLQYHADSTPERFDRLPTWYIQR